MLYPELIAGKPEAPNVTISCAEPDITLPHRKQTHVKEISKLFFACVQSAL